MLNVGDLVVVDKDYTNTDRCKILWIGKYLARISINGNEINISKNRLEKKISDVSTQDKI